MTDSGLNTRDANREAVLPFIERVKSYGLTGASLDVLDAEGAHWHVEVECHPI